MQLDFEGLNWLAILLCVVVGQIFLSLWFALWFAKPWAKAYGVDDAKQHTKEIPGYTYAVGLVCVLLLSVGLALLQARLSVDSLGAGLLFGLFIALHFCVATALPGYAFLKRWSAFFLAIGSQTALILIVSVILAIWRP